MLGICANLSVFAQTKFSISYEDTVSVGEPVKIKYIVEDDIGFEETPKRLNFNKSFMELLSGPYTSSCSSFRIDHGKRTTNKSISFTYTFLCSKPGMYYVPSLTIVDSFGKEITFSDKMSFYVSDDEKYRKHKDAVTDKNQVDTLKSKILDIVAVVDKNKISLGDSVNYQIHLFTNLDVVSFYALKDLEVDNVIRHEIPTNTQKIF